MISEKERVIMEELVKGQEAATQLKGLLENPIGSEDSLSLSPEELLENVLSSFSQAISIINVSSFQPPPPPPAPHVLGSTSYSMSEDCSVNWNRSEQGQSDERDSHSISVNWNRSQQDRRGSYKRKGKGAPTRTEFSNTTDDGYVWRKYGEKPFPNSKFIRCTYGYGHDQRCMATKQVQQCEENPDMYEITYIGNHTCNANLPTRNDERLHEGSDHEMQNRENDSLYSQFRGKQKIIDSESSWSLLTSSSDRNTDTTLSNSHDYSGPS
ncbi:WRKY DNA-binding transcription factor 70 isoform X2 [Cajanus cajan]|uniref:WRKY DNA-binding transcription factor 70 isoform X2 n=1 Tax=Cajanus cajan TaxID=3821 RepID=UPI00098D8CC3|nr:WRKY DNA-binding transcription factor 70 isoform X2 [Cajanus cajan]